jgi:hypothetical protein
MSNLRIQVDACYRYWILATARFFRIGWTEATDVYSQMLYERAESDETTAYRLEMSKRSGRKARGWA